MISPKKVGYEYIFKLTINQRGNVCKTQHWNAFVKPLLQWKSNEYHTNWVCVFVALSIQCAMRMRHIAIYGLPHSTVFCHIISKKARFSRKNLTRTQKVRFDFLYKFFLKLFFILRRMYIGLHVKYPLFLSEFNEPWTSSINFWKK